MDRVGVRMYGRTTGDAALGETGAGAAAAGAAAVDDGAVVAGAAGVAFGFGVRRGLTAREEEARFFAMGVSLDQF
jgi:hypothetical protein